MKIKKNISELQIGMHVCDLDRPWIESSFLFQGFEIANDHELVQLRQECKFVYIDTEKSIQQKSLKNSSSSISNQALEFVDTVILDVKDIYDDSIESELTKAKTLHTRTQDYIDDVYTVLRKGGQLDVLAAKDIVSELVEQVMRNPDAMVWLCELKEKDEYTAIHSVNVCILSLTFGRTIGLTETELNTLGLGALLFDVGKSRIPDDILKKTDSLNTN